MKYPPKGARILRSFDVCHRQSQACRDCFSAPQALAQLNRSPKSQNKPLLSNIDRLIPWLLCMEAWENKKKVVKKGNLKEIIGNVDTRPLVDLVFRLIIEELI